MSKAQPPPRTLKLNQASNREGELANELIRLNRELNEFKYKFRQQNETIKKLSSENAELQKQVQVKQEALNKYRKDNQELSLSLNNDHFKSIHALEKQAMEYKAANLQLKDEIQKIKQEHEEISLKLQEAPQAQQNDEEYALVLQQNSELVNQLASNQTLNQQLSEALKQSQDELAGYQEANLRIKQEMEDVKAAARVTRSHYERAERDAEAYKKILREVERKMEDCMSQKQAAELEVRDLRARFMKIINQE